VYYAHFGLSQPPFKITPNTDFFFSGGQRGAVLDALVYAISNGEGIIKVVGEVGSGKTMLCRMLQTILPQQIESIYLANPNLAAADLLPAIAFELQLKLPEHADRLSIMQQLQGYLLARHGAGRQVVIFVEEAQGMPLATLEELRLLSNLETKQDKLLQIVLFGQPELDLNLKPPHMRQLRERITHSFYLQPLQMDEISAYLIFRLQAAGYRGPHLFSAAAIKKLATAADGLVRRINILADKSLLAAYADNAQQLLPKHVSAAIEDTGFDLKPMNYRQYFIYTLWLAGLLSVALAWLGWLGMPSQDLPSQDQTARRTDVNQSVTVKLGQVSRSALQLPPAQAHVSQSQLHARLAATTAWLQQAPDNAISLQIQSLSDDAGLNAELDRISRLIAIDRIYLYRKKQDGLTYSIILYGEFTQRHAALAAARNLPSQIKKHQPYLRTVAGIKNDINQK
jgi:type II secretory pathway predicted ATPase ExeA